MAQVVHSKRAFTVNYGKGETHHIKQGTNRNVPDDVVLHDYFEAHVKEGHAAIVKDEEDAVVDAEADKAPAPDAKGKKK